MTGQRVTALYYTLDLRPEVAYKPDARTAVVLDGFNGKLAPERCKFTATAHYGTEDEARAKLEPQLHTWRRWVELTTGRDWLPFCFDNADSEPWPPPGPGEHVLISASATLKVTADVATARVDRSDFPGPPPPFVVDECTEIGLALLADARRMPRHVLKFASAFLSLLESEHGGDGKDRRGSVTAALNLTDGVLRNLGTICTDGGTGAEARAFKRGRGRSGHRIELTSDRTNWVLRVFGELVKRQGQYAAGNVPPDKYDDPMP